LIGKVDVAANRVDSTLDIQAIHQDAPFTRIIKRAVDDELAALASWLGLDRLRVASRASP
jgi:uncharacterized protein YcaQ